MLHSLDLRIHALDLLGYREVEEHSMPWHLDRWSTGARRQLTMVMHLSLTISKACGPSNPGARIASPVSSM